MRVIGTLRPGDTNLVLHFARRPDGRPPGIDRIRWLQGAEPAQLHAVTLSPSGEGLHFAELDVDLSIRNLLADLGIDPA